MFRSTSIYIIKFVIILFSIITFYLTTGDNSFPSVTIKNGNVQGIKGLTVDQEKEYFAFRGIPYAKAPVGELRFKAPVPATNWDGVWNASNDGSACTQTYFGEFEGNEDCLFINVYTPQLPTNNSNFKPRAVMVWSHGGGYLFGNSKYFTYGPDFLLNYDVVVVTLNYRLGIFGFLSTEDEASPGNYGLKDQVLALIWVQENIEYFGGDPKLVTIFGESAGGSTVGYLMQTNRTRGLFHRSISQSGHSTCVWSLIRNPKGYARVAAGYLGINATTTSDLVERLRQVNYEDLHAVAFQMIVDESRKTGGLFGLPFGPSIEPKSEEAVVTTGSYNLQLKGKFHRVPHMNGYNSEEGLAFPLELSLLRLQLLRHDVPVLLVPISMNVYSTRQLKRAASKIADFYFEDSFITSLPQMMAYGSDVGFVVPIHESVRLMAKYIPVYYYLFDYSANGTGVGHLEELAYIWRTDFLSTVVPQNSPIRHYLLTLWTNFAKYGNPTPTKDASLGNVSWIPASTYGSRKLAYLHIKSALNVKYNPDNAVIRFWNNLYDVFGTPPYETY